MKEGKETKKKAKVLDILILKTFNRDWRTSKHSIIFSSWKRYKWLRQLWKLKNELMIYGFDN